ncbi:SufE family protein [Chitinibacteraceae bacterium HSL-7]
MSRLAELETQLAACASFEAKNRLLVQLARALPPMDDALKTDAHRVNGCESQVWLACTWRGDCVQFYCDSDSRIIKGLLVLVDTAFQGADRNTVASFDFGQWLAQAGLARYLSSTRANGLAAIVSQLRHSAP